MRMVLAALLLAAGFPSWAEVYRCPRGDTTVFSDRPCGDQAVPYQAQRPLVVVPHQKAPDLARQYDERLAREKKARD